MPLFFAKEDIVEMAVDAIVNPTDEAYSGGGGTDRHIQKHAGPRLEEELDTLDILPVGQAAITGAYDLPSKFIIHTHGPVWDGGNKGEERLLKECYRNCLKLAEENGCSSIAFPLISGGTFGFPNDDALRVQKEVLSEYLRTHNISIHMVTYHKNTFNLGAKMFADVADYVSKRSMIINYDAETEAPKDLESILNNRGETFSCMLERLREEKGMTRADLYNKAYVSRSVYSKIVSNMNRQVSKETALALGLALELPLPQLQEFLNSAGYSLKKSSIYDGIIEYCVLKDIFDIDEINDIVYDQDPRLPMIGC